MKVVLLLEELNGLEPFEGLSNFLVAIEEEEDAEKLIKDFLDQSHNCDNILKLLSIRKLTQAELSLVFNFLGYVLMSIANNQVSYQEVGIHVTRWILQNQVQQLISLLNRSNSAKNIISALHCITGMVLSGNASANEVITHLDFNQINFKVLAERGNLINNSSIRIWIFNLILGFLNTGDVRCIRTILQVEGSVSSLFSSLENDPEDRVIKLINLLHEVVVLNLNISKTLKVKTFNSNSCGNLMKLYRSKTCVEKNVISSLHRLMITLCTDHKHGIIFKEKVDTLNPSIKSNNMHVLLILKSGKDIWRTEEGMELVAKTLRVCPDITKFFMESFQNQKMETSDYFFSLMKLFSEITKNIEPCITIHNHHRRMKGPLSLKDNIFFIQCVTNKLLIELVGSSSDILIHCGFILLHRIYSKVEETLSKISQLNDLTNEEKEEYRKSVLKIAEHFSGGCSKICTSWNKLFLGDVRKNAQLYPSYVEDHPSQFALLSLIVSVYLQYGELFGYYLLRKIINPFNMLENILKFSKTSIDNDCENYQQVLIKLLNFLLFAQSSNDFELFGYLRDATNQSDLIILNKQWFVLLLNAYSLTKYEKNNDKFLEIQNLCLKLLNATLVRWGLATHCPVNLHVWLNKLFEYNNPNVLNFLADTMLNTVSNLFAYIELLLTVKISLDEKHDGKGFDLLTEVNNASEHLVSDNEDVQNELNVPFSYLVIGASEILKEANNEVVEYFSSVMCDYVCILDHPKILANYLVSKKLVSCQTELYFNALLGSDPVNVDMKDDDNLSDKLRTIFISWKYPKISEFCESLKNMALLEGEQISLCRQLLLYLQVHNNNIDDKKKIKFYWKVLRLLLSDCNNNNSKRDYTDLYRSLLEHPFIIENYKPFLSTDFIHLEIENILQTVLSTYPKMHFLIRPFIKKLLFNLQNLPKDSDTAADLVSCVSLYTSHYTVLNSEDLQAMINSSFYLKHSEVVTKLLCHLMQLLLDHSDCFMIQFSNQSMQFMFSKLLKHNSGASELDEIITDLLSQILRKSIDVHFAATLTQDDLKQLVNGNTFYHDLCCHIINLHPSHASIITKQLKKSRIDLAAQVPYVLVHIELENENKYILTYLCRIKEPLLLWINSADSEDSSSYEKLIIHMLQRNIFEFSELQNICNHWYTQIIQLKVNPPSHILNLSPIYDFLSKEEKKLHENTSSANLQYLSINIALVSKLYGKEKDIAFTNVSSNILRLVAELNESCIKSELESLSKIWSNFIKKVLKHGLSDLQYGPQLLTCVAALIKIIYMKPKNDLMIPLLTIHQMLLSHSEFISLLLNQAPDNLIVKEKVVTLIQTIVEIESDGCEESHIPLFLGGYNASRSKCDQAILKLLFWYEKNGLMPTYSPIIWGKSAISHFAIEKGPGRTHEYRHPRHKEIFDLLDGEKVIDTAMKFDMQLNLEPCFSSTCDSDVYDQRFLLLLFLQVTDEKPTMNVMEMISKGIVAIGLSALSSHCEEVWAAGSTILKNVVMLLEQSGYQNLKLQWMWLIAVLGYGLESKRTRIPSVIVHFLIKATQLLLNPDDIMYKAVLNYIYLKPALPFKVPELYNFYFSSDIEHHNEHRSFFLTLLSSGIRDGLDVQLCKSESIPKYAIGLLTSPTATAHLKSLALLVLKSLVSIPEGALLLVHDYGLLTQLPLALLPTVLCSVENVQKLLNVVLEVLAALWDTWNSKMNFSTQENQLIVNANKSLDTKKRSKSYANNDSECDVPLKKLKTSLGSIPNVSEGLSLKKYKNTENWLLLEYATCLKNISPSMSLYGSNESNLCYSNLCKEVSFVDS